MTTALAATAGLAAGVADPGPWAHGPWGAGFGWLFLLVPLFWVLVVVLLFGFLGRRWRRAAWGGPGAYGPPWAAQRRGAEQTLAERFAQGDIDEVEYRARLEVLRANQPDA